MDSTKSSNKTSVDALVHSNVAKQAATRRHTRGVMVVAKKSNDDEDLPMPNVNPLVQPWVKAKHMRRTWSDGSFETELEDAKMVETLNAMLQKRQARELDRAKFTHLNPTIVGPTMVS